MIFITDGIDKPSVYRIYYQHIHQVMAPTKPLRTIDVARETGISVNTVRLYEQLGYLPVVHRAANGYRIFREQHIKHVQLVRHAMQCTWIGGEIRQTAQNVLRIAAQEQYTEAQQLLTQLIGLLQHERTHAENAIRVVERWAKQPTPERQGSNQRLLQIGEVAQQLHVTIDELRSWERNGLLTVPRAANGYRIYGDHEIDRLLVIRTLRRARYSVMAILRLMHQLEGGSSDDLRKILDSPPDDWEMEQYPTDNWLSTVQAMCAAAQSMQKLLAELATLH